MTRPSRPLRPLTVTARSLPLTAKMPSRFFSDCSNGSKSSMVPIGTANWNSFDVPAALGAASLTPVALTTMGDARCVTCSPRSSAAATLTDVLTGAVTGRQSADQVTVYAPVGLPWQDLAFAWPVYQAAVATRTGREIDFLA